MALTRYIVSDCDSVRVFYDNQHYASTPEEAAADAIKAGDQIIESNDITSMIIYRDHSFIN